VKNAGCMTNRRPIISRWCCSLSLTLSEPLFLAHISAYLPLTLYPDLDVSINQHSTGCWFIAANFTSSFQDLIDINLPHWTELKKCTCLMGAAVVVLPYLIHLNVELELAFPSRMPLIGLNLHHSHKQHALPITQESLNTLSQVHLKRAIFLLYHPLHSFSYSVVSEWVKVLHTRNH